MRMKAQHAPSPTQADLLTPHSVASVAAQRNNGGITRARAAATTRVRTVLPTELNRLRCSQARAREIRPGESTPPLSLCGARMAEVAASVIAPPAATHGD